MKKTFSLGLVLVLLLALLPRVTTCVKAVQIWEDTLSQLQYDDYVDVSGRDVEILDAGGRNAVVKLSGNYLVASGIGRGEVRIDGQTYPITVSKAKINLIMIMGQSNAGNHFPNATSDVTCPKGTAYWWGAGKGASATEPVPYTQPSMGFHTPLLAELYAQSAAAGAPVKNVMIWQEGITSKDGQPIEKWAESKENTSGTDDAVKMLQNCIAYYKTNSDKYEIVSSGVYWLQGESDISTEPDLYTERFLAMWQRLKSAGMEYLAFFRVRYLNFQSDRKEDLNYTSSLSAQVKMINENPDFYMASTITENWTGLPTDTHTVDISRYITMVQTYGKQSQYSDGYGNRAAYADGKLTTTMRCLYGSNNVCHYGKFGYGILGADAACNMYRALYGQDVKIVVADTSGYAKNQNVLTNGQRINLDISHMTENLTFRADCGSTAGTLSFAVRSGETDITGLEGVVIEGGNHAGAVNTAKLRSFQDVSVTVTYTTQQGDVHRVICQLESSGEEHRHTPQAETGYPATFQNTGMTNGLICTQCGDVLQQQREIPKLQGRVDHWNLTLNGGCQANFYMRISPELVPTAQVQILLGDCLQSYPVSQLDKANDGSYRVQVGIAPAQLQEKIGVQVVNGQEKSDQYHYTVRGYCDAILAESACSRYHPLVKSLLHYGAMAQIHFGYHTQLLANAGIDYTPQVQLPENGGVRSVTGTAGDVKFYGVSLVMGGSLVMRCYFTGDVSNIRWHADGKLCTPAEKTGMYYVELTGIQDLEQTLVLTAADNSGNTLQLTCRAMDYLVRMDETGSLQDLLTALYSYHMEAGKL